MKRLKSLSIKIKLLLIVGLISIITIPLITNALKTPTFYLEIPSEVNRGDEITLKLKVRDASEFIGYGVSVSFDEKAFTYQKHTKNPDSDTFSDMVNRKDGAYVFSGFVNPDINNNIKNVSYDGDLGTITLKVSDTAVGTYDFNINVIEFVKDDVNSEGEHYTKALESQVINSKVTVVVNATGFKLESDSLVILNGDEKQINFTVEPEGATTKPNASYQVTEGNSVSVSNSGLIKTLANGKSVITINAYGFTKTLNVEVINPIEGLELQETSLKMNKDEVKKLTATVVPHNKNAEATGDATIKWSSNNQSVAKVDSLGNVTALKGGEALITAEITVGEVTFSKNCIVNVEVPIQDAKISDTSLTLVLDNEKPDLGKHQLVVNINPTDAYPKDITWKSENSNIATVENGLVTAISAGSTKITAQVGDYNFEVPVEVIIPIKELSVKETTLEMLPSQSKDLTLTINPTNTTEKSKIKWESSEPSVVKVSENGHIEALQPGNATITVKVLDPYYSNLTLTAKVNVKVLIPVEDVYVIPSSTIILNKGEKNTLGIETYPKGDGVQKLTVTWSSDDENIAKVNQTTGEVTAIAPGKTTIKGVVSNGSLVTANIIVENPITDVSFSDKEIKIELGETQNLTLNINPKDYYYNEPKAITWTSLESEIASVQNGVVTANKVGTTTIKATIASKTAEIKVIVYIPIKEIKINEATSANSEGIIEIEKGSDYKLTASVLPEETTESKKVTWTSSNEDAVSINELGEITILKPGEVVTITATASDNKTKATIKVKGKVSITDFTVSENKMTIYKGEGNSKVISTTITPTNTTESKVITWKSANPEIAKVNEDGKVTGLKQGTTTITGTLANGMQVSIEVEVKIIPLTDIKTPQTMEVLKGREATIEVEPIPANTTEFANITYESENEDIVIVSDNGIIKGLKPGEATIKVKVLDIVKEIKVTVKEIKSESIEAIVPSTTLEVGEEMDINIQITPLDTTDELTYTFETSDDKIVTVSEDGTLKAVGAGSATITITASNGLTTTLTLTIKGITANPQTGIENYLLYLVISIISLIALTFTCYGKKKLVK